MRLLDAILQVNQRRIAGDRTAMIPAADCAGALPLVALTCIDPRLNHLLPESLGIAEEQFIWLRNAGNIITGPLSSTMRSLALALAVKGGKEIAIIGHSDCQISKTTMLQLLDRLGSLGVDRHRLPENLVEYFGLSASERQNVLRAVEFVRASPLIGTKTPVHGLMLDLTTGRVECVANGYEVTPIVVAGKAGELFATAQQTLGKLAAIGTAGQELKLPTAKIGEYVSTAEDWLHKAERVAAAVAPATAPTAPTPPPGVSPSGASAAPTPPKLPPNPLTTLQERMRQFTADRMAQKTPRRR